MIERLRTELAGFAGALGFDPLAVEQGSYQWERMRLGVISASRIKDVMTPGTMAPFPADCTYEKVGKDRFVVTGGQFNGLEWQGTRADEFKAHIRSMLPMKPAAARVQYMNELIAEIATQMPPEQISAKALQWGNDNEPKARDALAFSNGVVIHEIPFIYKDSGMRCGVSPDGIFDNTGCEIKCPLTSKIHVATLLEETINQDYIEQMQMQMWVTGSDEWTFASYDPRMPGHLSLKTVTVKRDIEFISEMEAAINSFIDEMDVALAKLGLKFGDQWSNTAMPQEVSQQQQPEIIETEQSEFNVESF